MRLELNIVVVCALLGVAICAAGTAIGSPPFSAAAAVILAAILGEICEAEAGFGLLVKGTHESVAIAVLAKTCRVPISDVFPTLYISISTYSRGQAETLAVLLQRRPAKVLVAEDKSIGKVAGVLGLVPLPADRREAASRAARAATGMAGL